MNVKQLTRIALMGSIMLVVFGAFSDILYLECITLTVILFAMVFEIKEALLAAVVFGLLNMAVRQGVTPWSMMYLIIYPLYVMVIGVIRKPMSKHFYLVVLMTGILSFLTGQLLEIPFLMVSKKIGMIYILLGLKTSLIQGSVSAFCCLFLYRPLIKVLEKFK